MRLSREPVPACACGLLHSLGAQSTWAEQATDITRYGEGVHGTMAERAEMLRAQIERDRRAVNVMRHINRLDGDALLVTMTTTPLDMADLLAREMVSYCHRHHRYTVTMVGYAVTMAWMLTEFELARIEERITMRAAMRAATDQARARAARDGG